MILNEYEIITRLGAGSFGIVYRAKLKKTNEMFVIKEIQMAKMDPKVKKWSMNQAKIMKQINSPYIVKCFNSFVEANKLYIVMQYCTKGDLCNYIKAQMGKPIKQQIIWKFTIQIMLGLRDLHLRKILHRDIKTLNIFLDENFNVRVGDLGVAKTLSTDFTSTIVGTPYYLSPEMCEQKPYNEKTDVWAFGCLVYELCTGKHPFQAQNQAALALKIVMGKFQDIPSYYSKNLRWLVHSCLSVDYKRRPSIRFLLQRQNILQQARKLNIILDNKILTEDEKMESNLKPNNTDVGNKNIVVQTKNTYVGNKNIVVQTKKIDEGVKKIIPVQKPPIQVKQNIAKNEVKPEINIVKKQFSSQQKRSQINLKKGNIVPAKNPVRVLSKDNSSKNLNQNKSKQKIVKNQNPPPAKLVINSKPTLTQTDKNIKDQALKRRVSNNLGVQVQKQKVQAKQVKESNNLAQQKKKSVISNDFVQKNQVKKQINLEDKTKIEQQEMQMIENLSLLDISKKKSSQKESIQTQKLKIKSANKTAFINNKVQQEVDDDLLMAQFGITPEKTQMLNQSASLLMKSKSINWNMELNKDSQIKKNDENIGKLKTNYLPTVQTPSQPTQISVLMQNYEQNELQNENYMEEQMDDNQPYRSDDQQEKSKEKEDQAIRNRQFEADSSSQQDSRYLIQNIQAEIQYEGRQVIQNQIQVESKRQLQNKKRQLHLQRQKDHTQKQYFSHLSPQEYKKIKQQINEADDKQVDRLMGQLTKGKQQLEIKFLKIIGFQMEISICDENIAKSKSQILKLKQKLEKGDFL